jgi:hypothetical protein
MRKALLLVQSLIGKLKHRKIRTVVKAVMSGKGWVNTRV